MEIILVDLLSTMESEEPDAELHHGPSPSPPLSFEVEMVTRLHLGLLTVHALVLKKLRKDH